MSIQYLRVFYIRYSRGNNEFLSGAASLDKQIAVVVAHEARRERVQRKRTADVATHTRWNLAEEIGECVLAVGTCNQWENS